MGHPGSECRKHNNNRHPAFIIFVTIIISVMYFQEFLEAAETIDECLGRCFVEEALGIKEDHELFDVRNREMMKLFGRAMVVRVI